MSLGHIGIWEEWKVDEERKRYWTLLNSDFFLQGLNFMTFLLFILHSVFTELDQKVSRQKPECQNCNWIMSCSHSFRRLTPKLKHNLSILLLVLLSDVSMVFALTAVFCLLKNFYFFTVALLLINFINQYQWQYEGGEKKSA